VRLEKSGRWDTRWLVIKVPLCACTCASVYVCRAIPESGYPFSGGTPTAQLDCFSSRVLFCLGTRRLTDRPSGFTSLFVGERGISRRKRTASSATKLRRSRRGCFRRGCMDDRNDIRIRPANVGISAPISVVTRVTLRDFRPCQKTLLDPRNEKVGLEPLSSSIRPRAALTLLSREGC